MATFSIFILFLTTLGAFQSAAISTPQTETENSKEPMVVPACGQKGPGLRRVGWGKFGLQFDVPIREVEVLGGKPDVDVRYVIKPKTGAGYVELWFGPYAMSSAPEHELLIDSIRVQKRAVVNASGSEVGLDNLGKLKTGELWRHTFIMLGGVDGARYKAGPECRALRPNHKLRVLCPTAEVLNLSIKEAPMSITTAEQLEKLRACGLTFPIREQPASLKLP